MSYHRRFWSWRISVSCFHNFQQSYRTRLRCCCNHPNRKIDSLQIFLIVTSNPQMMRKIHAIIFTANNKPIHYSINNTYIGPTLILPNNHYCHPKKRYPNSNINSTGAWKYKHFLALVMNKKNQSWVIYFDVWTNIILLTAFKLAIRLETASTSPVFLINCLSLLLTSSNRYPSRFRSSTRGFSSKFAFKKYQMYFLCWSLVESALFSQYSETIADIKFTSNRLMLRCNVTIKNYY